MIQENKRIRRSFLWFFLVLFIIQRLFDHHPENDHFNSMGILFSLSNFLIKSYLLVLVILLVRCNSDHRHYLVHHQVINVDIVPIIYYQLFHLVIVRNTVLLPMILVEVEVKLVIVHQILPNDHHHHQVQLHWFSFEFFFM